MGLWVADEAAGLCGLLGLLFDLGARMLSIVNSELGVLPEMPVMVVVVEDERGDNCPPLFEWKLPLLFARWWWSLLKTVPRFSEKDEPMIWSSIGGGEGLNDCVSMLSGGIFDSVLTSWPR